MRLAVRLLPAGPWRPRYRQELLAELHDLERGQQLGHAVRVLLHVWPLRCGIDRHRTLEGATSHDQRFADPPLHCRIGLYHHDRTAWTDDGHRYRRCVECGRDNAGLGRGPADSAAAAIAQGVIGGGS